MADFEDGTSYSDPIYDRLETAKTWMLKRWLLLSVLAIVISVGFVLGQQIANQTPDAEAALALNAAQSGDEDEALSQLRALLREDSVLTPPYRIKAGIAIANILRQRGELDEALDALDEVTPALKQAEDPSLGLALKASRAALLEEQSQWQAAADLYEEVATRGRSDLPLALAADLGSARCLLAMGDEASRQQAIELLKGVAATEANQAQSLTNLARYMIERIRLQQASPASDDPAEAETEAEASDLEATAPETSEPTAEAAPVTEAADED